MNLFVDQRIRLGPIDNLALKGTDLTIEVLLSSRHSFSPCQRTT